MNLRDSLAAITYGGSPTTAPVPPNPWILAAAVLVEFEPQTLNATEGRLSPSSEAMIALQEASTSIGSGRNVHLRQMKSAHRRDALSTLGTREKMREALALNPVADHPTQAAFAALVAKKTASVEAILASGDPMALAGLSEALSWLKGVLSDLPDPNSVTALLARARLLAPMKKLVGTHFAGREDVLADLAGHLYHASPEEIMMLQGPGGVGKSTVLAKFILDQLDHDSDPPTAILLNLDNPELVIDDPFTLLQEAGRQIRAQHPQLAEKLDATANYILSLQRRSRGVSEFESVKGGSVNWGEITRIAAETVAMVPGSKPILLVIDTFEEAQFTGPSAVSRLMQLVESLQRASSRLKIVLAGRVEALTEHEKTVIIDALDRGAAKAVLQGAAGRDDLGEELIEAVYQITNGNPLSTKLAGGVIAAEGPEVFRSPKKRAALFGKIRSEQVQARLYGRVLGHIKSTEIGHLAYPGLAVRRITPGVLMDVLAGPCHVPIASMDEANRLFDLFSREVALVEYDPQDGALRHRQDVRRFMLADLRADQSDVVDAIDQRAISYWRNQSGTIARAEELYHMMASGASDAELDQRWESGVEASLSTAIGELPAPAQVYLSRRLRLDLSPDLIALADTESWEESAERTARGYLRDGLPNGALEVLNQRPERTSGTKLYLTEAEALVLLEADAAALKVIALGTANAEAAGERVRLVLLRLLESHIRERAGKFTAAGAAALEAYEDASKIENLVLRLRVLAVLLRLHRRSSRIAGPKAVQLSREAVRLVGQLGTHALSEEYGLLRDLAAEIGTRVDGLVRQAISITGAFIKVPEWAITTPPPPPRTRLMTPDLVAFRDQVLSYLAPETDGSRLMSMGVLQSQQYVIDHVISDLLAIESDQTIGGPSEPKRFQRAMAWRDLDEKRMREISTAARAV